VLPSDFGFRFSVFLEAAWHLEWFAFLWPFDQAATDALDADAHALHAAVYLDLDALKVGPEGAPADAGDLAPDAAQVLGLAAPGNLIA
jgi:hypothetical protein